MVSGVDPPLRLEGAKELAATIRALEKSDLQSTIEVYWISGRARDGSSLITLALQSWV
jgi:hypothetical protein